MFRVRFITQDAFDFFHRFYAFAHDAFQAIEKLRSQAARARLFAEDIVGFVAQPFCFGRYQSTNFIGFRGDHRGVGVFLRDQAIALIERRDHLDSLIDHRDGLRAKGVELVVAVTTLAVEAEALASVLMVTGLRDGQMRLGRLEPRPSVYWLLGEGDEAGLVSTYRWSELARLRR